MNNIIHIAPASKRPVIEAIRQALNNGQRIKAVRGTLVFFPARAANQDFPRRA